MEKQYLLDIKERLSCFYNVQEMYEYNQHVYELYAVSNVKNTKYMASKKLVIYSYDNNSSVYVKCSDNLDEGTISKLLDETGTELLNTTPIDESHMSTHYFFVFVTKSQISDEVRKLVKKYRKQKSYLFGFKGWSSIGVIVVSLKNNEVIYSKDAKKIYKSFRPL